MDCGCRLYRLSSNTNNSSSFNISSLHGLTTLNYRRKTQEVKSVEQMQRGGIDLLKSTDPGVKKILVVDL